MLLGKRSRHPMKRSTSMTGITVDVSNVEDVIVQEPVLSDLHPPPQNHPLHEFPDANFGCDQRFLTMVSPRYPASGISSSSSSTTSTYHAVDSTTTAPFLQSCWLCNRRLAPGRDIYMYRGDTAFCSLECREQQIKQDGRKEKINIAAAAASKKEDSHGHASSTTAATTTSKASTKAEPVVAA